MKTPQELLSLLTDINYDMHELKQLLAQATEANVQYLKPLTLGAPDENGDRSVELGSKDFVPQPMDWPYCLDAIYSYKVMTDRVPNSLPRTLGHIVVPHKVGDEVWRLVLKINEAKEIFHKGCKTLYKAEGIPNCTTYTEFLKQQEVFNNGEHYEMVIRSLITSRHAYATVKGEGKKAPEIDFSALRTSDHFKVRHLSLKWVSSNYTQIHKGNYRTIRQLEEIEMKAEVAAAMDLYHASNRKATYVKRYYIPPAPIARYAFDDKWATNKFTVNSPILVFDHVEDAILDSKIGGIPVTLHHGTVRATDSLKKLSEKMVELVPGSNWYAV